MIRFSTLSILLAAGRLAIGADVEAPKPVVQIPHVSRAPRLADFLENRQREAEKRIDDFRQREPRDGVPASRSTAAYLSYDDANLYVIFDCKETAGRVRARMSRRESITGDDTVGVMLDTYHDGRHAYMFYSNPLGVQSDGIITEGQEDDYSFDTVWQSEGRVTNDGYIVRFVIPFRSLRFPSAGPNSLGLALTRSVVAENEISTWPYITQRVHGFVSQFGTVERLEVNAGSHNIQLQPYGFLAAERFLDSGAAFPAVIREVERRAGLDVQARIHESLTLDIALNPDFSQVESDEPQVLINQRYEVFFPEKRPFFIDHSNFFTTPEPLFFSRRIVNPEFGARLTGKAGKWGIGLLAVDDRPPDDLPELEDNPRAIIGVGRIQRELGKESNVGVLFTSRRHGLVSNDVFSADTRLKLNGNWIFRGQLAGSTTSGQGTSKGTALFAEIRHAGRHLHYFTNYRDRSPEFRPDLGFIPRVDIRQVKNTVGWRWRPEQGRLLSFGPDVFTEAIWDHRGRLQNWSIDTPFWFDFRRGTSLVFGRTEAYEYYRNIGFRKHTNMAYFTTEYLKWISFSASLRQGAGINYFPGSGLRPFVAGSLDGYAEVVLRPASRLRMDNTYLYSRLGTTGSSGILDRAHSAIFNNHLLRSNVNYQFTRALSLRFITDYGAVLTDGALYDASTSKKLTFDILGTFLLRPGTALYAGYNNRLENLMFLDGTEAAIRQIPGPSYSTGRMFFVKLSYLIRL